MDATIELIKTRFWQKVKVAGKNDCWEWTGAKDRKSYGKIKIRSIRNSPISAHRLSALWAGVISDLNDGSDVCHSCDNPSCVNPSHLWRGTRKQNLQDMAQKGRATTGSRNGASVLDEEKVAAIRKMLKTGVPQKKIAQSFGVGVMTVNHIALGRTWRHV